MPGPGKHKRFKNGFMQSRIYRIYFPAGPAELTSSHDQQYNMQKTTDLCKLAPNRVQEIHASPFHTNCKWHSFCNMEMPTLWPRYPICISFSILFSNSPSFLLIPGQYCFLEWTQRPGPSIRIIDTTINKINYYENFQREIHSTRHYFFGYGWRYCMP
jgi:hypothetical protein